VSAQQPFEGAPLDDAAEWHRIAEERRIQLERLQQQRRQVGVHVCQVDQ
jgi:hypothetical protein